MNLFNFDSVQSILLLALLLYAGELCSRRMKGMLPAVLVSGIIMVALVWTGIVPKNIVELSGFSPIMSFCIMMIILDMGASTNFKELWANRNVVALAALSLVFQIIVLLAVVGAVFGRNTAIAGLPGGTSVAFIVQERARALGYDELVTLSVMLIAIQNMIGAPIVSVIVRREIRRLHENAPEAAVIALRDEERKDEKKTSSYLAFFRLAAGAWLASRLEMLTGFSRFAFSLLIGILLSELGFLKKTDLTNTQSRGLLFFVLMSMVLAGFCASEPEMFRRMALPLILILGCDVAAICLFCTVFARRFGFTRGMAIAVGMEVMVGFPLNMMLTQDIIDLATDDENEKARLMAGVGTKLVIAGFTSLTTLSVIFASILVMFMK